MLDLYQVIFRLSGKTDPRAIYISMHCGIVYCQGNMLRPLLGHLQALWEKRYKRYLYLNALWDPKCLKIVLYDTVAYPGILFGGGGGGGRFQQIQFRTEDMDLGGGSPLVRGSGGSCNFVQEISFHIVKSSSIFGTLRLFMTTTNLFVIANAKQLRTGRSFKILLPFFPNILGCWRPKSSNF